MFSLLPKRHITRLFVAVISVLLITLGVCAYVRSTLTAPNSVQAGSPRSDDEILGDLIVGDSMAYYCNWSNSQTFGIPTKPIQVILQTLKDHWQSEGVPNVDTLYVFIGTADACFPVGMDLDSYTTFMKTSSKTSTQNLVNSPEKLHQFINDYRAFVDFIKSHAHCRRLVLIGPFPNFDSDNFSLINQASDELSKDYPGEFINAGASFYHPSGNTMVRDESCFKDNLHLSPHGYDVLKRLVDQPATQTRQRDVN